MRKGPSHDWIVLDYRSQPNRFLCERCGGGQWLAYPIAVSMLCAMGRAFTKMHRGCKARAEEKKL